VGLGLRLLWLWFLWDASLVFDEAEYLEIARALREGSYIDNGRWLRPPLFPTWLALFLGPTDKTTTLLLARLGQVFLGVVLVYLLYRIGGLGSRTWRVALLCGFVGAISFPLIAYSSYLMAEMLLLVVLAFFLLLLLRLMNTPSFTLAAVAGVVLGLAMLIKPIAVGTIPALFVASWLAGGPWKARLGRIVVAGACAAVIVAPWTVRNAIVYHRLVVLDTTGGFNLWLGNRLPDQRITSIEADMQEVYPNLADRDRAFAALARNNMLSHPVFTIEQLAEKARQFWRPEADVLASGHDGDLYLTCPRTYSIRTTVERGPNFGEVQPPCWWRWLNLCADVVYVPLLMGAVVQITWRWHDRFTKIAVVWGGSLFLLSILTLVQPRLRLPLMVVLIPLGVMGIIRIIRMVQGLQEYAIIASHDIFGSLQRFTLQRWRIFLVLGIFLFGSWYLHLVPLAMSQWWHVRGTTAWHTGDINAAYRAYETAVAWYPTRITTLVAAGQVAETLGREDSAHIWYQRATHVTYHAPQARIGSARVLQRQGYNEAVVDQLQASSLSVGQLERVGFAATLLPPRQTLDLGAPPACLYGYIFGIYMEYAPEVLPPARWTGAYAGLRFGTAPTPTSVVRLRASAPRPHTSPPPHMHITLNDTMPIATTIAPGWPRIYRMMVPPSSDGVTLLLHSDTIPLSVLNHRPEDEREGGILIDWAALDPVEVPSDSPPNRPHLSDETVSYDTP
jgi:4-amino-4-deoxy-L-arabinose transferase-like glycosyltransferase